MSLDCGRVRRLLWPDDSPREATPEVVEARTHLTECAACRRFCAEMRDTGALVARAAPRPPAPPEVRERLFRTIARARLSPSRPRRWPRWGHAAAAAAVLLGVGLWRVETRSEAPDPIAAFADEHLRAAAGPGVATSEAATAANWLRERLPFAIQVPRFPDGRLEGARLCLLAGLHGGVVEYRLGEHALSYFVVPANGRLPADAALELRSAVRAGYRVVAWRDGELVHALVADLPEATLRELARICIEQSRGGVAILRSPEAAAAPRSNPWFVVASTSASIGA